MQRFDLARVVEVVHAEQFLAAGHATLGQDDRADLLVDREVAVLLLALLDLSPLAQSGDDLVDDPVLLGRLLGGAGDDERRAGLVDQDGVDFVHDAEPVVALDLVFFAGGHAVVAEVIEAKLAGGAIGDVAAIHLAAEIGRHLLLDTADGDPEETVEVPHPLGVAAGEVVVDRHELGVATAERVQVERQR